VIGWKTSAIAAKTGAIAAKTFAIVGRTAAIFVKTSATRNTRAVCAIGWKTFAIAAKIDATGWKTGAIVAKTFAIGARIGEIGDDERNWGTGELRNWGRRLRPERGLAVARVDCRRAEAEGPIRIEKR
jgi:hypothetical protein